MCFLNGFWGDRSVRVRTGRVQKNQKVLRKKRIFNEHHRSGQGSYGKICKGMERERNRFFLYMYMFLAYQFMKYRTAVHGNPVYVQGVPYFLPYSLSGEDYGTPFIISPLSCLARVGPASLLF